MSFKYALLAASLLASVPALGAKFTQTNLTSDGFITTPNTDPNLKNPWGMSFSPSGPFWVSDNATGLTTLYNTTGIRQSLVVTIPPAGGNSVGTPTGQVFNPSTDFVVTKAGKSGAAPFLFDSEDGSISGWSSAVDPANAVIAVDLSSKGAVFKGIALYTDANKKNFLLAADLHNGVVDVFDGKFKLVTSFRDTGLDAVYAPHNVAVFGNSIYVAYAWVDQARHDVIPHKGWGVVEQVDISGNVLAKVAGGKLNAPWGLAIAPSGFGKFGGDLLVGNFGDGKITAYSTALVQKGQLMSGPKKPIVIDGLWGLIVGNGGSGGVAGDVYFTAGPNDEANGLFGSLAPAGKAH